MKTSSLAQIVFHLICVKTPVASEDSSDNYFERGLAESERYFRRLGNLDFRGKRVLDVGCGYGASCVYLGLNSAKKIIGIDIDQHRIDYAQQKVVRDYQHLSDIVDFALVDDFCGGEFDIIMSKDSFEHIANPEAYIIDIQRYLAKDGVIAIGFGPLWKSPWGGHIYHMTKLPWAHLLFPESVIMKERRRFRPSDGAQSFEQVRGGLNKMTLSRFLFIMQTSGLEQVYFRTNVSTNKMTAIFNILRRVPLLKEYFTFSVYSVWRKVA
jgi:SAM-dependent methyltransferase